MAATGNPHSIGTTLTEMALFAHRGSETLAREAAAVLGQRSVLRGQDMVARFAQAQSCVLDLSLGNYRRAFAAAHEVFSADPPDMGIKSPPDLVEAACRVDEPEAARAGLARLEGRAARAARRGRSAFWPARRRSSQTTPTRSDSSQRR